MREYESEEMRTALVKSWKSVGYKNAIYDALKAVSKLKKPRVMIGNSMGYVDYNDLVYSRAIDDVIGTLENLDN